MDTHTETQRCPVCLPHPGWAHPDEARRREPADVCRACYGSGTDLPPTRYRQRVVLCDWCDDTLATWLIRTPELGGGPTIWTDRACDHHAVRWARTYSRGTTYERITD